MTPFWILFVIAIAALLLSEAFDSQTLRVIGIGTGIAALIMRAVA